MNVCFAWLNYMALFVVSLMLVCGLDIVCYFERWLSDKLVMRVLFVILLGLCCVT